MDYLDKEVGKRSIAQKKLSNAITVQARVDILQIADLARYFETKEVMFTTQSKFIADVINYAHNIAITRGDLLPHNTVVSAYNTLERIGVVRTDVNTARHRRNINIRRFTEINEAGKMQKIALLKVQKNNKLTEVQQKMLDNLRDIELTDDDLAKV